MGRKKKTANRQVHINLVAAQSALALMVKEIGLNKMAVTLNHNRNIEYRISPERIESWIVNGLKYPGHGLQMALLDIFGDTLF